jgi:hypothetical protein
MKNNFCLNPTLIFIPKSLANRPINRGFKNSFFGLNEDLLIAVFRLCIRSIYL